jgi:hypothetical protein
MYGGGGGGGGGGNKGKNNNHHHNKNDKYHVNNNYYGRWGAGAVAAGVTAAAVGTAIYSLPAGCRTVYSGGVKYSDCGGTWYQPQYEGSTVSYVAVAPR